MTNDERPMTRRGVAPRRSALLTGQTTARQAPAERSARGPGGRALSSETAAPDRRRGARPPAAGLGRRTFASLRHRDFALLWVGTVVMSAGQWLQQITLSWLVFERTGSPFMLGLINGLRFLPFLFTSLIGGVMADRLDRRRLMGWTQGYLLVITLVMAVLLLSGRAAVWQLFAFTFISGIGWSFTMPVRQSIVPALVPREDLLNALALSSAAFNITRTVGPAVGGFLLAALGGGGNFLVQAACYAVVLATIAAMRVPAVPAGAGGRAATAWQSLLDGFRYVRASPLVLALLALGLVPMLLGMPYQSLLPIFAAEIYHMGAGGLGVLIGFAGLGSVLATFAVAAAGDIPRKGLVQLGALGALGLTLALYGQIPWPAPAVVVLLGVGAAQMGYSTLNQTQLQTVISDDMRGRVMSLYMLNVGLVPAGSFAAGAVAEVIGAPATVTGMGALITGIALFAALRFRDLRAR
jgi:MFS family permease